MRVAILIAVALVAVLVLPGRADAFRLLGSQLVSSLAATPRWPAQPVPGWVGSLQGGISVCVVPGFAESLGATTPQEIQQIENAVRAAFDARESPVVRFAVAMDCAGAEVSLLTFDLPTAPFYGVTLFSGPSPAPFLRRALQSHPPGIAPTCSGDPGSN